MTDLMDNFNTNVFALGYSAFGETFTAPDGTTFTAILSSESVDSVSDEIPSGRAFQTIMELRWKTSLWSGAVDEMILTRNSDSSKWMIDGKPENEGFGETIARVTRTGRARIGSI